MFEPWNGAGVAELADAVGETPDSELRALCGHDASLARALRGVGPMACLAPPEFWRRHDAAQGRLPEFHELRAIAEVDSEGPREALRCADAQGRLCSQFCLLPDSDFFAWERLLAQLPAPGGRPIRVDAPWFWPERLRLRSGRFALGADAALRFVPMSHPISASGERWAQAFRWHSHHRPVLGLA